MSTLPHVSEEDLQSQLEEAEDLWWRIGKLRMDVIALELMELSQEWESFQQMNKQVRIPPRLQLVF